MKLFQFNIGDEVIIKSERSKYYGQVAVVEGINGFDGNITVQPKGYTTKTKIIPENLDPVQDQGGKSEGDKSPFLVFDCGAEDVEDSFINGGSLFPEIVFMVSSKEEGMNKLNDSINLDIDGADIASAYYKGNFYNLEEIVGFRIV